jgi:hypothetical protein
MAPSESSNNFAPLLIAALVVPSLIWCLSDRSLWAWDQSLYGYWSLATWTARRGGIWEWLAAGKNAVLSASPLIAWLGQFFVPFRHATGHFESALLLLNVTTDVTILWLIDAIMRELHCRPLERAGAILLCGGAGIFIALCHTYLVETLVCMTTTLMIYVSLRADRMPALRCIAWLIIALSLSFLAKASSLIFVGPLACYVGLSAWLARRVKRPPVLPGDYASAGLACVLAAATIIWYSSNWQFVAQHFRDATVSDFALFWGSPVDLRRKLPYWLAALGKSLSPFAWLSAAIAVLIASAVVVATTRDGRQGSLSRRVETLWKRGTLFALTLAGAVILTIVAYSLQINEDQRFLIITTPMIAVLAGWSLHMLRSKLLSIGFALMLTLNAAATHLFAAGIDPVHLIPFGYLTASEVHESKSMALLKATIGPTCPLDGDNRARIVAVNYRNLNVNSTMFYSSQLNFDSARRCAYQWLPFPSKSFKDILDFISFVDPPFIVTVEPSRQPPPDFVNDLSKQVAEWLATNPRYERILMLDNGFSVYRQRASDLDD